MAENYDCIFVDRIENGRIVLKSEDNYGPMYWDPKDPKTPYKMLRDVPRSECGELPLGKSYELRLLKVIARVIGLNYDKLQVSDGIVIRIYNFRSAKKGLLTALITLTGHGLRLEGSTLWLFYIGPDFRCWTIEGHTIAHPMHEEEMKKVMSCVEEWRKINEKIRQMQASLSSKPS